jgi:hypothetical protein
MVWRTSTALEVSRGIAGRRGMVKLANVEVVDLGRDA